MRFRGVGLVIGAHLRWLLLSLAGLGCGYHVSAERRRRQAGGGRFLRLLLLKEREGSLCVKRKTEEEGSEGKTGARKKKSA